MNPLYKVLVLRNDRLDSFVSFDKAKAYFAGKGVNISYSFKDITELVTIHEYKKVPGFNTETGLPDVIGMYGVDDIVKESCKKYVKEGEYDCVIFSYNMDPFAPQLVGGNKVITSWNNFYPLYPTCGFIQLAINQYDVERDLIWKKIIHEDMHDFAFNLNRKGYKVTDEMDNTIVNGQIIPFYKNDFPDAPDGNYAHTFKNMAPYLDKLYAKLDFFKTQEFVPKETYTKFEENSNWFVDPRIRKLANFVRVYFGRPVTINNWLWGGQFNESGFREPTSTTGANLSQHRFGRAIDIKVSGMTPKQVYDAILLNEKVFMEQGLTCMENIAFTPTWVHLDVRNTGLNKILIVNP